MDIVGLYRNKPCDAGLSALIKQLEGRKEENILTETVSHSAEVMAC